MPSDPIADALGKLAAALLAGDDHAAAYAHAEVGMAIVHVSPELRRALLET